jgi:YVTN family beta-propeller protein
MNVIWKAACAAALIAATLIELGCGDVYRPISTPLPVSNGDPSGPETEVVLNLCPTGSVCRDNTGASSGSVLTDINVSGDANVGNKPLYNTVASPVGPAPGSLASPLAFTATRTAVLTANTATDSVTQSTLGTSTAGFAANTTTISLPTGSAPIGISFEFFGSPYPQDYVVNSGTGTANCPGTGSVSAILQASDQVAATVCVGAKPVYAWIYFDQSKVFVLDYSEDRVYVVNAINYQVTNIIPVGSGPFKAAQSNNGRYVYVLNGGDAALSIPGSISIIDGLTETVVDTVQLPALCSVCTALPIDMAMDSTFNDTSANTQINHVWVLHADGTVSVWDGTKPGKLSWITAVETIPSAQAAAPTLAYPTNLALMRDGTYAYVGVGNTDQIVAINTSLLGEPGTLTPGVNSPGAFTATTPITVGVHRGTIATPLTATLTDTETYTFTYNYTNPATGTVTPMTTVQVLGPFTSAGPVPVEVTTPTVTSVAVSREGSFTGTIGNSAILSKVYATTSTNTIYYCYDYQAAPTSCTDPNGEVWTSGNPAATFVSVTESGNTLPAPAPPPPPVPQGPAFIPAASGCTPLADNAMAISCPNLYAGTSVVAAAASGTTTINSYVKTLAAPSVVTYCIPGNPVTGEFDGQKNCPAMTPAMVLGRN